MTYESHLPETISTKAMWTPGADTGGVTVSGYTPGKCLLAGVFCLIAGWGLYQTGADPRLLRC